MTLENYPALAESRWEHPKRHYGGRDWSDHCVLISRSRDATLLERANYESALAEFSGKPGVEVTRFGHWGVGWIDAIMISVNAPDETLQAAEETLCALADYPVLDDSRLSEMESEAVAEAWRDMGQHERADYCKKAGVSIFAIRRDAVPRDCFDLIRDDYCQ